MNTSIVFTDFIIIGLKWYLCKKGLPFGSPLKTIVLYHQFADKLGEFRRVIYRKSCRQ